MMDKALLSDYLSESEQLLDTLSSDLDLLIERAKKSRESKDSNRGNDESTVETVNRVFRSVHSLKGLMGMMGLKELQALAHRFESALDDVRLGKLRLNPELAAIMQDVTESTIALYASEALRLQGNGERQPAVTRGMTRLGSLLDNLASLPRTKSNKGSSSLASLRLSDQEIGLLSPYERHRIGENLNAGKAFFEICVEFQVNAIDSRYRALGAALEDRGELIATLPGKSTDKQSIGLKLILAGKLKEGEIEGLVRRFGGTVDRIGPSSWRRAGAVIKGAGRRKPDHDKGRDAREVRAGAVGPNGPSAASVGGAVKKGAEAAAKDSPVLPEADEGALSEFQTVVAPSTAEDSIQSLSQSVRVDLSHIDEVSGLAHELYIEVERLSWMAGRMMQLTQVGPKERFDLKQSSRRIERRFLELEERLVEFRMVSLAQTFSKAGRLAERLARDLGKKVEVTLAGRGTQIDKMIVDQIGGPIYHVLRNAIDHGIEPAAERITAGKPEAGSIRIEAALEGTRAIISISDDGRGIDPDKVLQRAIAIGAVAGDEQWSKEEILRLIFSPGFSTARQLSAVSGRGVGLSDVERVMYGLGGEIRVASETGKGCRFELSVPTTLVMISAFIVGAAGWRYAINVGQIIELVYAGAKDVVGTDGKRTIKWRGSSVPLVELNYLLGLGGARPLPPQPRGRGRVHGNHGEIGDISGINRDGSMFEEQADFAHSQWAHRNSDRPAMRLPPKTRDNRVPAFITRFADRYIAVAVERFEDQREIIVKSLGPLARNIRGIAGAVDLEGGEVALVLDLAGLLMMRSIRL
jgi:two-component system, chemotaxis family, sensor kinase CheA